MAKKISRVAQKEKGLSMGGVSQNEMLSNVVAFAGMRNEIPIHPRLLISCYQFLVNTSMDWLGTELGRKISSIGFTLRECLDPQNDRSSDADADNAPHERGSRLIQLCSRMIRRDPLYRMQVLRYARSSRRDQQKSPRNFAAKW